MRIAHISDFHLRFHLPGATESPAQRSREIPELLAQAMPRIRGQQPDLLVVSGDLLDYPLDQLDDPTCQAQGEADLRLVRELLEQAECPLAVVYGNHDHPALFHTVFGHLSQDFVCGGYRVLTFYDAEDENHVPLRVGTEQQRFLDALDGSSPHAPDAADNESPPMPQIHVQHYVIWPTIDHEYPFNYGEAGPMQSALLAAGHVRLCLNGHYHEGTPLEKRSDLRFTEEKRSDLRCAEEKRSDLRCAETSVQGLYFAGVPAFCEPPHPFWIYDLSDSDVTMTAHTL